MDFKNCHELNQDKFEKITCEFKNRHFSLNVLLNIKFFVNRISSCVDRKKCLVRKIKRIYNDYEYNIYKNMFNLDFLIKYHTNIFYYLNELLTEKNIVFV